MPVTAEGNVMKLKTVIAKFEYVIVVEDDDTFPAIEAREHLIEALRDMGDGGADITVHDYTPGNCKDWPSNAIPYGGDGNTNTGEYLARHNAAAVPPKVGHEQPVLPNI